MKGVVASPDIASEHAHDTVPQFVAEVGAEKVALGEVCIVEAFDQASERSVGAVHRLLELAKQVLVGFAALAQSRREHVNQIGSPAQGECHTRREHRVEEARGVAGRSEARAARHAVLVAEVADDFGLAALSACRQSLAQRAGEQTVVQEGLRNLVLGDDADTQALARQRDDPTPAVRSQHDADIEVRAE